MKAFLVVLLLGATTAQFNRGNRGNRGSRGNGPVDHSQGGSNYHLSWRHPELGGGNKMTWNEARAYCNRLPNRWEPISINDRTENNMVTGFLSRENIDYIWTSGRRQGNQWKWIDNGPANYIGWSHTGGFSTPGRNVAQPDNREGSENCLAILNNVYQDGITWHDIACSHLKPVICEKKG